MYLVIRGDRLYAGCSETYTKKNGRRAMRGRIAKSLESKSKLLAQDPQALENLERGFTGCLRQARPRKELRNFFAALLD